VLGCEVWRDLDWLPDEDKQILPVSSRPNIAASLVGLFDSQISGGKRYDLATIGRRLANATYFMPRKTDEMEALTYAVDLTPMVENPELSLAEFVEELIDRFHEDVIQRIKRVERNSSHLT